MELKCLQCRLKSSLRTYTHYCVEVSGAGINRFSDGFFPSAPLLWNSLPASVFPASFNLSSFKRQVYHHLRDQMAWNFFFLLLPILDIWWICLLLLITFLFLFLRDADWWKGTYCASSVFSFIKKEKRKRKKHPYFVSLTWSLTHLVCCCWIALKHSLCHHQHHSWLDYRFSLNLLLLKIYWRWHELIWEFYGRGDFFL